MASTAPSAAGPSPRAVGTTFVRRYYKYLATSPQETLYRFYKARSRFTHAFGSEDSHVVVGQNAIRQHIAEMNLDGVKVELKHGSVDCQQSQDGGVLVMVSGCMASAKSPAYRPFVQTFFLAVQSKGFYVLNDSFRYLGDDNLGLYGKAPTARLDDELDLETARRIEAAQRAAEEAEAAKRAEEAEQARVAAQAAAAQLQAEREAADLAKAARDAEEAQARADAEAAAAAAAAEAAAAAAAAPAPAPAQAPPAPEASAPVPAAPVNLSYAAAAKKAPVPKPASAAVPAQRRAGNRPAAASAAAATNGGAAHGGANNSNGGAAASASAGAGAGAGGGAGGAATARGSGGARAGNRERTNGGGGRRERSAPGTSLFVRVDGASTEPEVREQFGRYGKVVGVTMTQVRARGFLYVDMDTRANAQAAVAAGAKGEIVVAGRTLRPEEKKPELSRARMKAGGGSNAYRNRRARTGRGGAGGAGSGGAGGAGGNSNNGGGRSNSNSREGGRGGGSRGRGRGRSDRGGGRRAAPAAATQ